ncbi:MAG: Ig-like domain-containing protein, partial [Clostridiales bacterium]|nr:Ig-like domain-containing protein [Clostridiales bacterium]
MKRLLAFWLILTLLVGTGSLYAEEGEPQEPEEAIAAEEEAVPVYAETITADSESLELHAGDQKQIQVTLQPEGAEDELEWSSSDESVAFVSQDGTVTAVGSGTTVITAKGETAKAEITVTVPKQKVEKITLSAATLKIPKGKKSALQAEISPDDAENQEVIWSSSNTDVATIDSIGQITAKEAGTTTITATAVDGGATATCEVTVTIPATKIVLDATKGTKGVKETFTLKPTLSPSNTTDRVKWSSSDKAIATVSKNGKVTPKKAGSCTITAKTDSGKKATYKLTVKKAPTSIKLNKTTATLNIKSKVTL